MSLIFLRIYQFFRTHRAWYAGILVLSFLICGWIASGIKLEEDITSILPADEKLEKMNEIFSDAKFSDQLVVRVSLKDSTATSPDSLTAFADQFVPALKEKLDGYIRRIETGPGENEAIDMVNQIQDNLPWYLDSTDYRRFDSLSDPAVMRLALEQNIRTLSSPAGLAMGRIISRDPVGISFTAMRKLEQLNADENLGLYNGYLLSNDLKNLIILVTPEYPPGNTGRNLIFLRGLDSLIQQFQADGFSHIDAGYFGATAVSSGNAFQLRKDAMLTQGITLLFLVVFLSVYFRKKRAPLVIMIPVIFGALFSLAMIRLINGSISVIALGAGSVILGIAVNYSLHVFNHYRHTRNMETVIRDLTLPMTVGSFTTIGGFLCLQFTRSAMLADLGLFAAFSLIGAALASLVFLPPIAIGNRSEIESETRVSKWINRIAEYRYEHNKWLVRVIILLTVLFAFYAGKAGFESEMMNMNYMSPSLRANEAKISAINADALQSVYLVAEGKTLEDALRLNERQQSTLDSLQRQGAIRKYAGISSLLISDSLRSEKTGRWERYWTTEKRETFLAGLRLEGQALGFRSNAFNGQEEMLKKNYRSGVDTNTVIEGTALENYITVKPEKVSIITLIKTTPGHRNDVYRSFNDSEKQTVMDKQYITSRLVEIINADFTRIALMTSILVFLVLLITYGRIELALVAFIPMVITWIWILGIMGMAGIKFNIVNIIISALIFALGDDYSLFIMDGLVNEYRTGKKNLSSFKSSIILSAFTTITGLGVLIFAKHPALQSIALISIIGIASVALIAQVMIPYFFSMLITNRAKKQLFPWTAMSLIVSMASFIYFILGSLFCTLLGWILFLITPLGKERIKLFYHRVISAGCWSVMYFFNYKEKIKNPLKEDFSKPAVIISNHQSFLDILCMIMLHPKLILFTNRWVWNSPVFGAVVRMADYFPVAKGVEQNLDQIAERVKQGYSVVIFPEGTRSPDQTIRRFHKGAFFLAEQLNLDILPIVSHGTGYTITKGDFLIKRGLISMHFLPRISAGDDRFGDGYSERAKGIGKYFRNAYASLKAETEQPAYFRETLKYNFIYKGPVLEWYMRIKTRLEKNYVDFHQLVPMQGRVLDIGCGYGFMSFMLHFTSKDRWITGIDYDTDKIETARHCFSRGEQLNFVAADVSTYRFERYDCIILADILHYLQNDQQKGVLEQCIRHLNPGGTLIIRDGNADLKKKHKGTELTEFFSTRLIGFNKTTRAGLTFFSGELVREVARAHQLEIREIDQTKYTSNMMFILKKEKDLSYATV